MPETHITARVLLGCRSAGARCLCARQNQTLMETSDSERDPLVTSALIVLTQAGNVLMGTAAEGRTSAGINNPPPPVMQDKGTGRYREAAQTPLVSGATPVLNEAMPNITFQVCARSTNQLIPDTNKHGVCSDSVSAGLTGYKCSCCLRSTSPPLTDS